MLCGIFVFSFEDYGRGAFSIHYYRIGKEKENTAFIIEIIQKQ